MSGLLGSNGKSVNGVPRGQLIGLDGQPAGPRAPDAQVMAKNLVIGLTEMGSFREQLKGANDHLLRHKQLPSRGQRLTLRILALVAKWQDEAKAFVREVDSERAEPTTADEEDQTAEPSPSEADAASHPPSASPTPPVG